MQTSRQVTETISSHRNADYLLRQRCCRLDIAASSQHLHQSIFAGHKNGLEQCISLCIAKDNIMEAIISVLVKEMLVNNIS